MRKVLHSRGAGHIVGAVLLLQTKIISIDSHQVKLFSVDGRLWSTKASDVRKFHQRLARAKRQAQAQVRAYCPDVPVASPGNV